MTTQNLECTCDDKKTVIEKDLAFMALTLASFAVALVAINTALLGQPHEAPDWCHWCDRFDGNSI